MMECQICKIPTSGVHYQIRSCRACAAFFRRTVKMRLRYKCMKNGTCNVEKENRYSCRHCRMKKCLAKGMTFEEDQLPNVDEFLQCPVIEDQMDQLPSSSEMNTFYSVENVFRDQKQFFIDYKKRLHSVLSKEYEKPDLPYSLSLCQQIAIAYEKHLSKWPAVKTDLISTTIDVNKFMLNFCKELEHVAEFCMEIEPFSILPYDQKKAIFRRFALKFHQIDRVANAVKLFGRAHDVSKYVTVAGEAFDIKTVQFEEYRTSEFKRQQIKKMMSDASKYGHAIFAQPYKKLNPDKFELMYLVALNMWSTQGNDELTSETIEKAARIRESLAEELNFYYKFKNNRDNYAEKLYKLHNLVIALDRMSEMHDQDGMMAQTFDLFKFEDGSVQTFQ